MFNRSSLQSLVTEERRGMCVTLIHCVSLGRKQVLLSIQVTETTYYGTIPKSEHRDRAAFVLLRVHFSGMGGAITTGGEQQ